MIRACPKRARPASIRIRKKREKELIDISDSFALCLGCLYFQQICILRRTSKWFYRRGNESLKQMKIVKGDELGESMAYNSMMLGYLMAYCPNIQMLDIKLNHINDGISITKAFSSLRRLELTLGDSRAIKSHQYMLIHMIADKLSYLEAVCLDGMVSVDVSPLQKLEGLKELDLYSNPEQNFSGVEKIVEKCSLEVFGFDEGCDFRSILRTSPVNKLSSITSLRMYDHVLTESYCSELVEKLPKLRVLYLHADITPNNSISILHKLVHLEELELPFETLDYNGIRQIVKKGTWPNLKKFAYNGEMCKPNADELIEIMKSARLGWTFERSE